MRGPPVRRGTVGAGATDDDLGLHRARTIHHDDAGGIRCGKRGHRAGRRGVPRCRPRAEGRLEHRQNVDIGEAAGDHDRGPVGPDVGGVELDEVVAGERTDRLGGATRGPTRAVGRVPQGARELLAGPVRGGGPLLLDLGEPVAQDAAHLVLGEGRCGQGLGEQPGGGGEVALGDVDVDEQAAVGDPGTEHHAVALHELGELVGPQRRRALVEQACRHGGDALLAGGFGGHRQGDDDPQRQHVLAGQVVEQHPHPVAEHVLGRDGEGPRLGRGHLRSGGAHATSSSFAPASESPAESSATSPTASSSAGADR